VSREGSVRDTMQGLLDMVNMAFSEAGTGSLYDRPLYPNLLASWLAPTTAKRGEEKNVFTAASILAMLMES